tara:strand:+ start:99 stop:923 length:825 start_codon:yes stop_codon:yes gene_type:complete
MKKILVAAVVTAMFGVAQAQSTIAVSGSIAVSMQNSMAATSNVLDLSDADINFSATEDLGAGMKINVSTSLTNEGLRGNAVTANNTVMKLTTGFGTITAFNGLVGSAKLSAGVSVEDDMHDLMGGYSTNNTFNITSAPVAGFTVGAEYEADDATRLSVAGKPNIIVGWAGAGATVRYENGGTANVHDVRATYKFGIAKVGARWTNNNRREVTIAAPVGPLEVGYHYATNGSDNANGIVAAYALSKRTTASANYVTGTGNGFDGSNYRVMLKHTF